MKKTVFFRIEWKKNCRYMYRTAAFVYMIIGTVAATAIAHLCVSYFAHSLIGSLLLCSLLLFF